MRRILAVMVAMAFAMTASTAWADDVISHEPFDQLLSKYVDGDGQVDYEGLKENEADLKKLKAYVDAVGEADPEDHNEKAQLAFYINAYNATVIGSIINHWPTDSPMSVKGFFKVEEHPIAGEEMTLDHLEHKIIRPTFEEPRIHFVLVCAAKSCPRLRPTALTASNLEEMLSAAASEFIPKATSLKDGKVVTSQLFNWFGKDFEEAAGSVRAYLAKYSDGKVAEALQEEDVSIEFSEYDWKLNKQ